MAAAKRMAERHTWLSCEPLILDEEGGCLSGSSKPVLGPRPPADAAAAKQEGLPDGTLSDLIDMLCELSSTFGVDWEISHDFSAGPIGYIRDGECDAEVRKQCDALSDFSDASGEDDFEFPDL
jgi:hypothetical protein